MIEIASFCGVYIVVTESVVFVQDANCVGHVFPSMVNNYDSRLMSSLPHVMATSSGAVSLSATPMMLPLPSNQCSQSILSGNPLGQAGLSEASFQCPATEEGEVPESDLDPNTRRRLLILQHGQDIRDPPPPPPPPPPAQPILTICNY